MSVRFLGTTDEVDTCDCCGRKGLKSTVGLSIDDGEAVHYGVTCAARALNSTAKDVRASARAADEARDAAAQAARDVAHRAELAAWDAFLASAAPVGVVERFARIQALGGMVAARAAYVAAQAVAS